MSALFWIASPAWALSPTPDWEAFGDPSSELGSSLALGDVNGDGVTDIVAGTYAWPDDYIAVFHGGPTLAAAPDHRIDPPLLEQIGLADVNGDGFDDLVTSEHLFNGSPTGLPASPDLAFGGIGEFVSGDFDGDGYADIARAGLYGSDELSMWAGGANGPTEGPLPFRPPDNCTYGFWWVSSDLENDGFDDLLVGCSYVAGPWTIYGGGADGLTVDRRVRFEPQSQINGGGTYPHGVGDVDGDGLLDLLATDADWAYYTGTAHVYPAGPDGLLPTPMWEMAGPQPQMMFGLDAAFGDFDADGDLDVVVGAPNASIGQQEEGVVLLYENDGAALGTAPAWTWAGGVPEEEVGASIAVGDVNGDGTVDLVSGNGLAGAERGAVRVFFGDPPDADGDGDGHLGDDDCNDADPTVYVGAPEIDGDGVDQSCDGRDASLGLADLRVGELVITEVMFAPTAGDGQWFEIEVLTAGPVDLVGLTVATDDTSDVGTFFVVTPGEPAVIATSGDEGANGGLVPDRVHPIALSDEIRLANGDIDLVALDLSSLPPAEGASVGLDPASGEWCPSTSSYGDGDLGTPGAPNDGCVGDPTVPGDNDDEDPSTPTDSEDGGCGCQHGTSGGWALMGALILLLRRRPTRG